MRAKRRNLTALLGFAGAAAIAFGGCGGDDETAATEAAVAERSYVGTVAGTKANIGVVVDDGRLTAYVCDSRTISIWLSGRLDGRRAELSTRSGRPAGELTFSGDRASGRVTVAGRQRSFALEPAQGAAGIYRRTSGTPGRPGFTETGWVRNNDGRVDGATSFIDPTTNEIVVRPATLRVQGRLVTSFIDPTVDE